MVIVPMVAIFHLWVLWPGTLSPDSQGQYAMAMTGICTDHHPPLMSFVWRYLDKIWPGPGMMLLLHLSFLYGAVFYLMRSVSTFAYRFLFIFLPLIPQVFIYSGMIWKDVGFAFSFLFVSSFLAYLAAVKQKLTGYQALILLIILLYGTAIKFQAQYCAPVLLGWITYIFADKELDFKKFIQRFFILTASFYIILFSVNDALVTKGQKNHSWQYVKLYDLAAISVDSNESLFPEFAKNKNFTMEELSRRFNHQRVDDLVFTDPILKMGVEEKERKELYSAWVKAIWQHPLFYVKHRAMNTAYILLSCPGFETAIKIIEKTALLDTVYYKFLYWTARIIAYLTMAHFLPILLGFVYFFLGLACLRTSWAAIPLICFNGVGIVMLLVLFFCSMAGTPRYTYINICMLHASHVFAYLCYKNFPSKSSLIFARFARIGS
jgi:hypothetical protein